MNCGSCQDFFLSFPAICLRAAGPVSPKALLALHSGGFTKRLLMLCATTNALYNFMSTVLFYKENDDER
jgi:hypothetical protein